MDDKLKRQLAGWALLEGVQAERQADQRRQLQQQREQRERDTHERHRLAALERELHAIKAATAQAQHEEQHEEQQRAALQYRQQLFDELGQLIRPPQPQPVEPSYVIASDGTAQLGYVDFNAELMSRPLRWW